MKDAPLESRDSDAPDEPPPFLGSWRRIYVAVVIYLAIVIFAFYLFGRAFTI